MDNNFSGVIKLTGLDDFISPGVECIKPIQQPKLPNKKAKVVITESGNYNEVDILTGKSVQLEKASISLKDCLACSGCVTSAETVLINQQSVTEFLSILDEKKKTVIISISPQTRAAIASQFKITLEQANQKLKILFNKLGIDHIFDTTFSRDFSLLESRAEFVEKYKENVLEKKAKFALLNSTCPGWICYAEKTCGDYVLPYISSVKSPQQIMGSLIKYYYAEKIGKKADEIYHVSIMPCYDKKLEASRTEFYNDIYRTRDVDTVLTSTEILEILQTKNFDFMGEEFELKENNNINININNNNDDNIDINTHEFDKLFSTSNDNGELVSGTLGGSGGYAEYIFKYAAKVLFNQDIDKCEWKKQRNADLQELSLEISGKKVLSFAIAYGFRNIQNIVRKIKTGTCSYHYVEVMACPSGCLNGGGQIRNSNNDREGIRNNLKEVEGLYQSVHLQQPHDNVLVNNIYKDFIKDDFYSTNAKTWLHTTYKPIQKDQSSLSIRW